MDQTGDAAAAASRVASSRSGHSPSAGTVSGTAASRTRSVDS
ncbi:Uncharacterised protein [Mycobacteroides abscessus]|nr:Uncharacterised protein [Mycobacteroides abscessus]